jgi:hypothetical protein
LSKGKLRLGAGSQSLRKHSLANWVTIAQIWRKPSDFVDFFNFVQAATRKASPAPITISVAVPATIAEMQFTSRQGIGYNIDG